MLVKKQVSFTLYLWISLMPFWLRGIDPAYAFGRNSKLSAGKTTTSPGRSENASGLKMP